MNTKLKLLFEKYNISEKNRYEINQFFNILPDHKKQKLLVNFENLAFKLLKIEQEINIEREILIGTEVDNIKNIIINSRINKQKEELKKEILGSK